MKQPSAIVAILAVVALVITGTIFIQMSDQKTSTHRQEFALKPNDPGVRRLGQDIYREHCAACHGRFRQGQRDWRKRRGDGRLPAPPHDEYGHTWHHPDHILFAITKFGPAAVIGDPSYPSDMPAYEDILTDEEIIAVLSFIKSRWPENIKDRHDQIQKAADQNDP